MSVAAGTSSISIPVVSDADIEDVERHLGVTFDQRRREILRSNDSFDVQACPGSGKTTLLVAKLAILGTRWPHARRGICVLSHTNVARQEIENKLAGTVAAHRLLSYPHFVGTIHGFVNAFLAMPLLRSEGHHVRAIDDDAHGEYCMRLLRTGNTYATARNFLRNSERFTPHKTIKALRYEGSEFALKSASGKLPCGKQTPSFENLRNIKADAAAHGYWRHDDMFAWAHRLLSKHPQVALFARHRFPVVFVDEAQDTSELQGSLLDKVFSFSACDIRQRFGDSNQAIYDSGQQVATTDPFPAIGYKSLPNSQRFGANIAAKVHSLAPDPPSPALVGEGPCRGLPPGSLDLDAMRHTIFLFGPRSAHQVLPAFGSLLLQAFQDGALRNETFLARAIGLVGKSDTVDEKYPRHLGDYWGGYEPRAAKADPRPRYLADHVHLAQQRRAVTVDCAQCVKAVLKGICELIEIVRPAVIPRGEQRGRWLWEALRSNESSVVSMRHLIWEWCVEMAPIAHASWAEKVEALRLILLPVVGSDWNQTADKYCRWSVEDAMQTSDNSEDVGARNCYRFHKSGRHVDIDVGTIHSAKGQTHTATLVVESHYEEYDLQDLLPWLSGIKSGAGSKSKRGIIRPKRMRLIYTAMTRPSHLLCLALRADAIEGGGAGTVNRDRLENLGWNIQDLRVTGVAD